MLYTNAILITMDQEKNIFSDGAMLVKNGKIADLGGAADMKEMYPDESCQDMCGDIIMPGMINTHTHAPMVLFRGLADDLPLKAWLEKYIWPMEKKMVNADFVKWGVRLAMMEMIASGTTCFSDMYFFEDAAAEAVNGAGMRALLGEGVIDFPTPDAATPEEEMRRLSDLAAKWKGNDNVRISVCAHSPYTCSPDLLLKTKKLADKLKTVHHIHVAETKGERDSIAASLSGESPVKFLQRLDILDASTLAAHCVWTDAEDINILAECGVNVAHNPSSNLKLASGTAPVADMLKNGVNVSLGTDGAASNNNLDMFREMRMAALIHKGASLDPEACGAYDVLEMATINGARALSMDDITGSLEIGKYADFIVVDTTSPNMTPMYDPVSHLVYSANGADVRKVYVSGRLVYRNGEYLTMDAGEVYENIRRLSGGIYGALNG